MYVPPARLFAVISVACSTAGLFSGSAASGQRGAAPVAAASEWPTYGHDAGGKRYSPLTQITPANASQLKVVWVYHMKPVATVTATSGGSDGPASQGRGRGPVGGSGGFAAGETTPIVINGVMYVST